MTTIDDVVNRLRAEFLEMPGLRLTSGQVQRLCGVEKALCQRGLDSLVATKFCTSNRTESTRGPRTERCPVHVWREPASAPSASRKSVMTGGLPCPGVSGR